MLQSVSHEFLISAAFLRSSYPTAITACPPFGCSCFRFGIGMMPVFHVPFLFFSKLSYTTKPNTNGYPSARQLFKWWPAVMRSYTPPTLWAHLGTRREAGLAEASN